MHAPANPVDLILMAILQGLTELFPVSSLGHSVLVPAVLHWNIDRQALWFLPFLVVLHLGTAGALLLYFRREWIALIGGGLRQVTGHGSSPEAQRLWLLVVGTVPAGLVGLILEHRLRHLFGDARLVAVALAAARKAGGSRQRVVILSGGNLAPELRSALESGRPLGGDL